MKEKSIKKKKVKFVEKNKQKKIFLNEIRF